MEGHRATHTLAHARTHTHTLTYALAHNGGPPVCRVLAHLGAPRGSWLALRLGGQAQQPLWVMLLLLAVQVPGRGFLEGAPKPPGRP